MYRLIPSDITFYIKNFSTLSSTLRLYFWPDLTIFSYLFDNYYNISFNLLGFNILLIHYDKKSYVFVI